MSNALADKLAKAQERFAARGGLRNGPKRPKLRKQWTRQIVKVTRMDAVEWNGNLNETDAIYLFDSIPGVRTDPVVDAAITDLLYGNVKDPDDRPPYLNAPELLQDIFMCFLKPQPTLYKKSEVKKDARLNGKFVEQMMALPTFEEVHDYTMTDPETAKEAMLSFVDVVKELIKQHREQVEQSNEDREADGCDPNGPPGNSNNSSWDEETKSPKGKKGKPDKGESQFGENEQDEGESQEDWEPEDEDGDGEFGDEQDPKDEADDGEGGERNDDGNLDDHEREFDEDYLDDEWDDESNWSKMLDGVDLAPLANHALKGQAEQLNELNDLRTGVGIDDAEWKMMDPKQRMAIAKQLNNPRMKAIADMVGRMKRFALAKQAQKIIDAPHEIFTVEMGNDLRRTLRSEFALLGTPETKIEFYRRYIERQLLQYKERGHEDVGKGPIIVCIDNSGSMGGNPENWAKGVAEALRRIASDQDRDFHVIYFETNRHRERFDFPKGKGSFEKIMAFLSISAGGGTEFDGVLTEALAKAQTKGVGETQGKADIVFITDGQAYLDQGWIDRFNEERTEAGVRVFSIFISAYDSERSSAMGLLEKFSDRAIPVKALEVNDDTTSELFSTI